METSDRNIIMETPYNKGLTEVVNRLKLFTKKIMILSTKLLVDMYVDIYVDMYVDIYVDM